METIPQPRTSASRRHTEAPADVDDGHSWRFAGVAPALREALGHMPCLCSTSHTAGRTGPCSPQGPPPPNGEQGEGAAELDNLCKLTEPKCPTE